MSSSHVGRAPRALLAAAVVAALAHSAAAAAQQQDSRVVQGLEEVVVTAQRREESLQSVPVAVTTLSEAMLERQNIRNIAALDQIVPNIVMNPNTGTSSASKIFLRGVGEDESFFTADTPVGLYVDDVYIARQTGAMFDLFDVERLEVLRGPQGTLYGRNTSAGAVKLVTRKPELGATSARAEVAVGNFDLRSVRLSGNLPLGDKAAVQLAGLLRERDGYTKNRVTGKDVNDQDVKGARASLLVQPTDGFRATLVGDLIRERSTPGYAIPLQLNSLGDPLADPVPKTGDFYVTNSDIVGPQNDLDQYGLSLTLEFDATDALKLKSVTSYRALDNQLYLDADGDTLAPAPSRAGLFHLFQDQQQYQVSQEFQGTGSALGGKLEYVAGVFWFKEHNDQITKSVIGLPALFGLPSASAGRIDLTNAADEVLTTDAYAAFASATYHFSEQLSGTVGLRYTSESKDYRNQVLLPSGAVQVVCLNRTGATAVQAAAAPCTPAQTALGFTNFTNASAFDRSWNDVTPRFVLDYKLTPSALLYASAAKGFKGGTTSGRDTAALRNLNRIVGAPETNWSYEAGLKADWLDNRLRTNVAAFYNKYKGLQFGVTTPDGGFGRINAGDAEIKGVELEATAVPVEGLELSASVGVLDGKYTEWTASLGTCAAQGLSTRQQYLDLDLKQAPKWSYRLGGNYSVDMGGAGVLSFGADWSAKAKHYNNLCNSEGIAVQDYQFLNAQVRWENADGNLLVTLAGSNLTDEEVFNGGFDFGRSLGFASAYLYPPRMWTLSVRYSL
jgi:iron complex outermembrane receptor protein